MIVILFIHFWIDISSYRLVFLESFSLCLANEKIFSRSIKRFERIGFYKLKKIRMSN